MPLQNRVTPFGDLVAVAGRGTMMGNRGSIHDRSRRIVRPWQVRRWIACVLEFRGRHRDVMPPDRWTALFFLDEAAAFAAGHRPCGECRRAEYQRFKMLWAEAFGAAGADDMDVRLHADRVTGKRAKRTYRAKRSQLPGGTYVALDGVAFLLWKGRLLRWSDAGYTEARGAHPDATADVLTPRAMVEIFAAGYVPAVHESAARL